MRPTELTCACGKKYKVSRRGRIAKTCPKCRDAAKRKAAEEYHAQAEASGRLAELAEQRRLAAEARAAALTERMLERQAIWEQRKREWLKGVSEDEPR